MTRTMRTGRTMPTMRSMRKIGVLLLVLLPALLAACAANRPYEPPRADLTDAIEAAAADTSDLPGWRDFYRNETLRALIREGLERNGDLEIARLRVDEALAALRGARGLLWPAASPEP